MTIQNNCLSQGQFPQEVLSATIPFLSSDDMVNLASTSTELNRLITNTAALHMDPIILKRKIFSLSKESDQEKPDLRGLNLEIARLFRTYVAVRKATKKEPESATELILDYKIQCALQTLELMESIKKTRNRQFYPRLRVQL